FFTCAAEHTFSDNYSFDAEALLIAGNGDVGKVSYYKGKFEAYQRTYVLTDFLQVSPRFLFHILDGKLKDTVSKQKLGNTMPYIKVGMLTDFEMPVPPLAEQQRIVGVLDEAFEGIATAQANAEKNLQNARALFDAFLNAVYTGNGGSDWPKRRLGDVFEIGSSKRIHERDWSPSGVPFYGGKEIVKLAKFGHAVSNAFIS
ncbi:MAG: restriction endonuclease subunit S, partial [Candidatus Hydrogenedentes bacterium]|nr:restriction endonuclease subunit S [Candidatus Hydrogenedentota bacterium]